MDREGKAPKAIYSMGKFVGEKFVSDPSRKALAVVGRVRVVQKHDPFWGPGKDFEAVLENPSFADLFRVASRMIAVTGDWHHQFFEGVHIVKRTNNETIVRLVMGS
jgi:hypothetical protein